MAVCGCFRCKIMANDAALKALLGKALDVAIARDEWDAVEGIARDLLDPVVHSTSSPRERDVMEYTG